MLTKLSTTHRRHLKRRRAEEQLGVAEDERTNLRRKLQILRADSAHSVQSWSSDSDPRRKHFTLEICTDGEPGKHRTGPQDLAGCKQLNAVRELFGLHLFSHQHRNRSLRPHRLRVPTHLQVHPKQPRSIWAAELERSVQSAEERRSREDSTVQWGPKPHAAVARNPHLQLDRYSDSRAPNCSCRSANYGMSLRERNLFCWPVYEVSSVLGRRQYGRPVLASMWSRVREVSANHWRLLWSKPDLGRRRQHAKQVSELPRFGEIRARSQVEHCAAEWSDSSGG